MIFEKDATLNTRLTVPNIVRGAVALPIFGFVFCVLLSYIKNFEVKGFFTRHHCSGSSLTLTARRTTLYVNHRLWAMSKTFT
jgi:hypothetical protein